MNFRSSSSSPSPEAALNAWFDQLRLARAAEMAEHGRFLEAEGLLMPNGQLPSDPAALDILARIAAHQGDFDAARSRWHAALQAQPDHPASKEGLAELEALANRGFMHRCIENLMAVKAWEAFTLITLFCAVLLLSLTLWSWRSATMGRLSQPVTSITVQPPPGNSSPSHPHSK